MTSGIKFVPAITPQEVLKAGLVNEKSMQRKVKMVGEVPLPKLQKLVGHSRLLTTLYYLKPTGESARQAIANAVAEFDSDREASISRSLLNDTHISQAEKAICNSSHNYVDNGQEEWTQMAEGRGLEAPQVKP